MGVFNLLALASTRGRSLIFAADFGYDYVVWVELAKCVLNFFFFCCGAQFTAIYVYTMTVSGAQNNKENAHT